MMIVSWCIGMAVATKLDKGFIALRKAGKLPVPADSVVYHDYSRTQKTLELARGSITSGARIIVVDEWIETGASVTAAITLIEKYTMIMPYIDDMTIYDYHSIYSIIGRVVL